MASQGNVDVYHDFNLVLQVLDVGLRNKLCLSSQQICNLYSLNSSFLQDRG